MALSPFLTKPIVNAIVPWSADTEKTITFSVTSGAQFYGNQIEIDQWNGTTESWSTIVLDPLTMSSQYQNMTPTHAILANTLTNDTLFRVRVRTYDNSLTNYSVWSDYRNFYCLPTAAAAIEDLVYYTPEQVQQGTLNLINGGSLLAIATVSSLSSLDQLIEYRYTLKDYDTKETIMVYPLRFYSASLPMAEEIENVDKNRKYELSVTVLTQLGQTIISPSYCIIFDYFLPNLTSIFQAVNGNKDILDGSEGTIVLQGHFVRLIFEREGTTEFEYDESLGVNLLNTINGKIFLDEGLNISGNWNLKLWVKQWDDDFEGSFILLRDVQQNIIELSYDSTYQCFVLKKTKVNGEISKITFPFPSTSLTNPSFVSISSGLFPLQVLNLFCEEIVEEEGGEE